MTVDSLNARPHARLPAPGDSMRIGLVTTFPPTRCGIGRFSESLVGGMAEAAPELDVEVVRLVEDRPGSVGEAQPVLEIVPDLPIGIRSAARRLNRCDVAIFQHEYGIYGANDGEAILEMVRRVQIPKIAVLHTVLERPSTRQRHILEQLADHCHLVTVSTTAGRRLVAAYGVDPSRVTVIPHGANWRARRPNPVPRRNLITWGLLSPGKGLEMAIEAMTHLKDLTPPPIYRIVGRTHPGVVRREGYAYRRALEHLVKSLDLGDVVQFVDRYLEDDELYELVAESDVVVLPYDNTEQISSGVLTEAIGAGRPVVATRFPHALELLGHGSGFTVDRDSTELAGGIRQLLTDGAAYESAASAAAATSAALSWSNCADSFRSLIRRLVVDSTVAEPIDA